MKNFARISLISLALPAVAAAQNFDRLIDRVDGWVGFLTGTLASLALLVFFWGLVKYIWAAGSEDSKASGKKIMVGGVIALFVLFSVFGIVRFLQNTFGLGDNRNMQPPAVDFGKN